MVVEPRIEWTGNIQVHYPARDEGLVLSPDCRDKNHTKCNGMAWDLEQDAPTTCKCRDLTHGAIGDPHED